MTHKDVFKVFKDIFPNLGDSVTEYFECGRNCIRVRGYLPSEMVFTYKSKTEWTLESLSNYISHMNERRTTK